MAAKYDCMDVSIMFRMKELVVKKLAPEEDVSRGKAQSRNHFKGA
jgi:hypothetical protein